MVQTQIVPSPVGPRSGPISSSRREPRTRRGPYWSSRRILGASQARRIAAAPQAIHYTSLLSPSAADQPNESISYKEGPGAVGRSALKCVPKTSPQRGPVLLHLRL